MHNYFLNVEARPFKVWHGASMLISTVSTCGDHDLDFQGHNGLLCAQPCMQH